MRINFRTVRVTVGLVTVLFLNAQCTDGEALLVSDDVPIGSAHQFFDNHKLAWQDTFDGTALDTSVWRYDTDARGNRVGWGNNERQFYTTNNATVANGSLTIEARRESMGGKHYTSSRIHTHGGRAFQYGVIEAQMRMPSGADGQPDPAVFPAFWLLGDNFDGWGHDQYGGDTPWPQSGEIDIAEVLGNVGLFKIFGSAHWHEPTLSNCTGTGYRSFAPSQGHCSGPPDHDVESGTIYSDPHIYTIVWNQDTITWYFDYTQYAVLDIRGSQYDEFREEFFILLNFAIARNPAHPPVPENYPQRMVVDWVRHYCPTDPVTGACTTAPTDNTPQTSCAKAAALSCPAGSPGWVYGDCRNSAGRVISNLTQGQATNAAVDVRINNNKGAFGTVRSLSITRSGGTYGGAGWQKSGGAAAEDLSGYTNLHFSYCLEPGVSTSDAPFFVKVESSSSSCNEYTPTGLVADGTWREMSVPVSTLFGASNGGQCTTAPSPSSANVPFYLFLTRDVGVNIDEIYYQ